MLLEMIQIFPTETHQLPDICHTTLGDFTRAYVFSMDTQSCIACSGIDFLRVSVENPAVPLLV